jgi:hypothetical protein
MKKVCITVIALAIAALGFGLATGDVSALVATVADNEQVCEGLDSGKIDVSGDPQTVTITAPDGFLISRYCVKAGSENQGDGPVYVDVNPPQKTVTISHPSGKDISHYSYSLVPVETTTETTTMEITTTTTDTTTTTETTGTTPTTETTATTPTTPVTTTQPTERTTTETTETTATTPTTETEETTEASPRITVTEKELEKELEEQERENRKGEAPRPPRADQPGTLPRTGLPLGLTALLGAGLVAAGGALRRMTR